MATPSSPPPEGKSAKKGKGTLKDFTKKSSQFFNNTLDLKALRNSKTAKAALSEKLGGHSRTRSVDISEKDKLINEIDLQLPKVYRSYRNEMEKISDLAQCSIETRSALEHYSQKIGSISKEHSDLGGALQPIVDFENEFAKLKSSLTIPFVDKIVFPLNNFVRKQIPIAKDAYSTYNQSRLTYEGALTKHESLKEKSKDQSKLKEAEAEVNAHRGTYENAERDLRKIHTRTTKNCEVVISETMMEYLAAYRAFFTSGITLIDKMLPQIQQAHAQQVSTLQNYEIKHDTSYENADLSEEELAKRREQRDSRRHSSPMDRRKILSAVYPSSLSSSLPQDEDDDPESNHNKSVDEILQAIISKENQQIEDLIKEQENYIQKHGALPSESSEAQERQKKVSEFDYDVELQHGSRFYKYLIQMMKEETIPALVKQLEGIELSPVEEEINSGKLGMIQFGLGIISLQDVMIPVNSISVSFTQETITIVWNNISAKMDQVEWYYNKETGFPKFKDDGNADAAISKGIICVTINVDRSQKSDSLTIMSTAVKIGHLDVKISGSKISPLYNIVLSSFTKSMKAKVQKELQIMIEQKFESSVSEMLEDFVDSL